MFSGKESTSSYMLCMEDSRDDDYSSGDDVGPIESSTTTKQNAVSSFRPTAKLVMQYSLRIIDSKPKRSAIQSCRKLAINILLQKFGFHTTPNMAHTKWEYVRKFETNNDDLLPNSWAVARIDGRGFHKFAKKHSWARPNDIRGIGLMNNAAKVVMKEFEDIILGYGQSDEYSFIFRREAEIFERRGTKIITTVVSKFASAYVFHWSDYFPDVKLQYPPSFDGRMVLYPTDQNLRDYLCWRQADCHINNLFNTTFWSLVLKGNLSHSDAEKRLSGTLSGQKNEILFSEFGINYNNEREVFKKGTILVQKEKAPKLPRKAYMKMKQARAEQSETVISQDALFQEADQVLELNCDIISDKFWEEYPYLLNPVK